MYKLFFKMHVDFLVVPGSIVTLMVMGGIMCIPSRFTAPRCSLVAYMLPRELRWEEVAPPHKGMTQWIVPELGGYKLNCKVL